MRWVFVGAVARSSILLTIALPSIATAQPAAPASPAAGAPSSLQQAFNAASDTAAKGDCANALPLFEKLAADPRVRTGSLPAATIELRRGICLTQIGRIEEGERAILAGLPIVRKAGPQLASDVASGEEALGDVAMRRHDYDAAASHYKPAMEPLSETARVYLLIRLAQSTAFNGGGEALAYTDQALRIMMALPKPDRASMASIHTVRGRILMNQGRNREALVELKEALALRGGLKPTATLEDAAIRGDLAQAALLNRDPDSARLYLAYTGAGRIEASPFAVAASMAPPQCGPETGLSPADSAIVGFGINDQGNVSTANTVFTRGNAAVAAAFERAVEQWYWRPADLLKIPLFYKVLTRVELRCSTSGGQLPGLTTPLLERFSAWAGPLLGGLDVGEMRMGVGLEKLAALARQYDNGGNPQAAAAAQTAHGILNSSVTGTIEDLDKAMALATASRAPSEVIDAIIVFRTDASEFQTSGARRPKLDLAALASADATLKAHPALAADALASDTLLLLATPPAPGAAQRPAAMAAFSRVANDARLADHHPLRQVALLRLANLAAAGGNLEEAHGYFVRTGLSEEQCALIGVTPALQRTGASSNDYPDAAMAFGFEGWVNLEYDINADGKTANPRALVAYPPFVFVDAATGITKGIRYQASYRPSNAMACSANLQTIRFLFGR